MKDEYDRGRCLIVVACRIAEVSSRRYVGSEHVYHLESICPERCVPPCYVVGSVSEVFVCCELRGHFALNLLLGVCLLEKVPAFMLH